jgi:hypothetical protein
MVLAVACVPSVSGEEPSVEQILKTVENQIAPDVKGVKKHATTQGLILDADRELNRLLIGSKDPKLRVIHAITCLSTAMHYFEHSNSAEHPEHKEDYQRMIRFREILAKEYLRLSK